eukprot:6492663-Amphidinium_carterae.1
MKVVKELPQLQDQLSDKTLKRMLDMLKSTCLAYAKKVLQSDFDAGKDLVVAVQGLLQDMTCCMTCENTEVLASALSQRLRDVVSVEDGKTMVTMVSNIQKCLKEPEPSLQKMLDLGEEWLSLRSKMVPDKTLFADAEKRGGILTTFAYMVGFISDKSFNADGAADNSSQEKLCQVLEEFFKLIVAEKQEYGAVLDLCKDGIGLNKHLTVMKHMHQSLPEVRDIDKACSTTANKKRNLMRIEAAKKKILDIAELPAQISGALAKLDTRVAEADDVLQAVHSGMVVKALEKLRSNMAALQQLAGGQVGNHWAAELAPDVTWKKLKKQFIDETLLTVSPSELVTQIESTRSVP